MPVHLFPPLHRGENETERTTRRTVLRREGAGGLFLVEETMHPMVVRTRRIDVSCFPSLSIHVRLPSGGAVRVAARGAGVAHAMELVESWLVDVAEESGG